MNISEGFVLRDLSKGEKFAKRKLEKTWRSVQLRDVPNVKFSRNFCDVTMTSFSSRRRK